MAAKVAAMESKMRGSELDEAMVMVVDCLVNDREGMSALNRAIESTVTVINQFNCKDAMSYLEAYQAERIMRDILEDKRLARFPWVVTSSIHAEVLKVQADY